jgi:hypothetical protein
MYILRMLSVCLNVFIHPRKIPVISGAKEFYCSCFITTPRHASGSLVYCIVCSYTMLLLTLSSFLTLKMMSLLQSSLLSQYFRNLRKDMQLIYSRFSFCDGSFYDDSLLRPLSSRTEHSRLVVPHCRNSSVHYLLSALLALFRCACVSSHSILVQFY